MRKNFTHELVESFTYSAKGNFNEATTLLVEAPKSSDFYEGLQFLDSLYNRAELKTLKNIAGIIKDLDNISEADKQKAKDINEELDNDEVAINTYNQLLSGLEQNEIKQLNICIKELLKKSAKINGEDNFEDSLFDELCIEDRRLIIGKYLVNFTSIAQRNLKRA